MKKTISIYEGNLYEFKKRVEKFNNKLKKYGKEERVEYTVGEAYDYKCTLDGYTIVIQLVDISLDDVTVVLNTKHKIVASVEIVKSNTKRDTIVEIYDRKYKVEDFQHITEIRCDHCKSSRNRKRGFILENLETGDLLHVGSTCMKDYTQDLSISDKLKFNTNILEDYSFNEEDYMGKMLSSPDWVTIEEVIAYTNRVVKKDGKFISLKHSDYLKEESTKEKVEKIIVKGDSITDEEMQEANEIIEVIKNCNVESIVENDFNIKLIDMIKNRYCKYNKVGQAVWIYNLYEQIKKHQETDNSEVGYVGEIGEKLEMELKSLENKWVETYYGMSCMNKFVSPEGNILIWWTTKEVKTEGTYEKMKFTIKDQKMFREEYQTIITRAKIIK